jgi:hypothetical protein
MLSTAQLWGGTLTAVTFDPVAHRLALRVEVLTSGVPTAYEVTCNEVSTFRFANSIPLPWTYAEVTEAHARRDTSGRWVLELMLWSEDAEITCACREFVVQESSA